MNGKIFDEIKHTDEEIDEELLSALINAGAHEYIKSENSMPSEEEISKVSFSDEFEKRMKHQLELFEESNKKDKRSKLFYKTKNIAIKAAASLFVIIAITSVFVATSKAFQIKFMNVFIEVFDISTDFSFDESDSMKDDSARLLTRLEYIPFGMELITEDNGPLIKSLYFENSDGLFLEFTQQEGGSLSIDTEDAKVTKKVIGNFDCIVSEKKGITIVVFNDKKYAYTIISSMTLEEVIKTIESIR